MDRNEKIGLGVAIAGVLGDAITGVIGALVDKHAAASERGASADERGPENMTAGWLGASGGLASTSLGGRRGRKLKLRAKKCGSCDSDG